VSISAHTNGRRNFIARSTKIPLEKAGVEDVSCPWLTMAAPGCPAECQTQQTEPLVSRQRLCCCFGTKKMAPTRQNAGATFTCHSHTRFRKCDDARTMLRWYFAD
jgi:hypothetical protein